MLYSLATLLTKILSYSIFISLASIHASLILDISVIPKLFGLLVSRQEITSVCLHLTIIGKLG